MKNLNKEVIEDSFKSMNEQILKKQLELIELQENNLKKEMQKKNVELLLLMEKFANRNL